MLILTSFKLEKLMKAQLLFIVVILADLSNIITDKSYTKFKIGNANDIIAL